MLKAHELVALEARGAFHSAEELLECAKQLCHLHSNSLERMNINKDDVEMMVATAETAQLTLGRLLQTNRFLHHAYRSLVERKQDNDGLLTLAFPTEDDDGVS